MKLIQLAAFIIAASSVSDATAAGFSENFCDSTLRLDCILGGGPSGVHIMLDSQSKQKGWAGRRTRLNEVPVEGNGTVMVTDPLTGDTLYRNTFSLYFRNGYALPKPE